jgi:hypothetical protein
MTKEIAELDELLEYAERAMADGYPYEVIDGSLALTVKALRAYRASLEPTAPQSEIAWLIEQSFDGVAHWWYGSDFIADANQAVRFCRSADANTVIMERGLVDAKAVEHMWHEMPAHG